MKRASVWWVGETRFDDRDDAFCHALALALESGKAVDLVRSRGGVREVYVTVEAGAGAGGLRSFLGRVGGAG